MRGKDVIFLLVLLLLVAFIWLRESTWISTADDTLPILVALPLFAWLGAPWSFYDRPFHLALPPLIGSALLFLVGIAFNVTFLLALAWTLLLWIWLSARVEPSSSRRLDQLLLLPMLAFPWIALDINSLGWWFRLSGTWITGGLFTFLGFNVIQEGTNLLIDKLPISIEASCAGLNTLQSMLVAGVLLDYIILGNTVLYWINLPLLVLLAWVANTMRIIVITSAALFISPQFAMGTFHVVGGWLVIVLMFLLCWMIFALQEPRNKETWKAP